MNRTKFTYPNVYVTGNGCLLSRLWLALRQTRGQSEPRWPMYHGYLLPQQRLGHKGNNLLRGEIGLRRDFLK